jgi:excisionase family DNA binding protein
MNNSAALELDRLLTIDELSQYLGTPKKTLYDWRTRHVGPQGFKVGREIRYRQATVAAWLEQREQDAR